MTVKYTQEFVEAEYLKGNIKLLSLYVNNSVKNDLECLECGYLWKATFSGFHNDNCGCPKCYGNAKLFHEFVENAYLKSGIKLLSRYVNCMVKNDLECLEYGHEWKATFSSFKTNNANCPECWRLSRIGENSPNWNHELTKENRKNYHDRSYTPGYFLWRKAVYDRDDYTCQFCNIRSKGLEAHHIDAWATHKSERLNVDNGVTLCETCHTACHAYHILSGYRSANYKSFYQWMVKYSVIKPENWLWTVRYPDRMNKTIEFFNQPSQKLAI